LLREIAEGKSLVQACRDGEITRSVVYEDLLSDQTFADNYARACEIRADAVFDDLFEIADDGTNDWMERNAEENKGWVENGEALGRSRLRVDARKWALARMNPRKYGDKITQEHTGGNGGPLAFTIVNQIIDPKADGAS
jgi:hypothetical protein